MVTSNIFPQRLKELRLKKGLTQTELGEKVGVKQSTFTNWENGKREPSFENLIKLADLLDVSLDWLFGRDK
ncbi:transcriptional regulator, Cro/CI family [Streptococcus oralis]|uniref:Transcriptional regulator, Cro/CI family n=1 Tax=Streptococcus oralis TaxID=1303 RepID=A0A139P544_STROR|nr:helix-turn-helix transcriptional regulator [Streptococcus oralis]KXT83509.1 transcriptional regulator, Cro/CI family [Streptococcus oralis]